MAAVCQVTGAVPGFGHNISFSHRRTKRRFDPNVQRKTYWVPTLRRNVTLNVSGPGEFIYNADGTISATLRGQSILIPPGVPIYVHNGPMHLLIGTDGVPTLIGQSGTGFDPCSLVA